MRKLAVIFPGVGYTYQKPLLYYTAQTALDSGYEIIRLDYGEEVHSFKGRTESDLIPVITLAEQRTKAQLADVKWKEYDNILFISKSIGTTIACRLEKSLGLTVTQFLMTPIPLTIPFLKDIKGCFLAGTNDPYIDKKLVIKAAQEHPDKTGKLFEKCNHSLEQKGKTEENIKNLLIVIEELNKQIQKSSRYTILRIDEADFGCEGRPEGEPIWDLVWLRDENGREIRVKAEDKLLYERKLDEGDKAFFDSLGLLSKYEGK